MTVLITEKNVLTLNCPYLLRGTTAVRMQGLFTNGVVLTLNVLTMRNYSMPSYICREPTCHA